MVSIAFLLHKKEGREERGVERGEERERMRQGFILPSINVWFWGFSESL